MCYKKGVWHFSKIGVIFAFAVLSACRGGGGGSAEVSPSVSEWKCEDVSSLESADFSCAEGSIKYLAKPEDLFSELPAALLAEKSVPPAGIDNSCSEDVNLKERVDLNVYADLNYLANWFKEASDDGKEHAAEHNALVNLVKDWNYNLVPEDINASEISNVAFKIRYEDGSCSSINVSPCGGYWNVKFTGKIKNASAGVVITKNNGTTESETYGPFTVGSTWYVRPAKSTSYGVGNGMSYENAFNGLKGFSSSSDSVQAGDTVFITGLQLFDYSSTSGYGMNLDLLKSGNSKEEKIVYRGDYPSDLSVVWGAGRLKDAKWEKAQTGVYAYTAKEDLSDGEGWFFEDIGKGGIKLYHKALARAESLDKCITYAGSYYFDAVNKKLYVHTSDNQSPDDRISAQAYGYQFFAEEGRHEFITLKNIIFFAQNWPPVNAKFSYFRGDGLKLAYGAWKYSPFTFWYDNDHIDLIDSELSCFGNGVYAVNQQPQEGIDINDTLKNYVFKRLYIHDVGIRNINQNADAHAVGLQGASYGFIEDSIFDNVGSGVVLWTQFSQDAKENVFRRNFVKIGSVAGATAHAFVNTVDEPSSSDSKEGTKTGNVIEDNIVENCNAAHLVDYAEGVTFQNNVIYNCQNGVVSHRKEAGVWQAGSRIIFKGNVSRVEEAHLLYQEEPENYLMDFDNNLYNAGKPFYFRNPYGPATYGMTFAEWRGLSCAGCRFDTNSSVGDDAEIFQRLREKYDELNIPQKFRRSVK